MIRLHQQPAVGILTEEVNRILGDDRAVLLLHKRQINPGGLYLVDQLLRDFPLDRRIKHPVIGKQIAVFHRFQILRRRLERFSAAGGVDQTNLRFQMKLAELPDRFGIAHHHVVGTVAEMLHIDFLIGRIIADHVAAGSIVRRLVDRHIQRDAVAEMAEYRRRVIREFIHDAFPAPAPLSADIVRQIVVNQRDIRNNAVFLTFCQHVVVKLKALFVDHAVSLRHNPRPADRKAIGVLSALRHHPDILLVVVEQVAGHIAGNPGRVLFTVAKLIPDARSLAVRIPSPFTLVSRGRGTP